MVQHILGEICTRPLEKDAVAQLIEMIGQLEDVKVIKILGSAQAGIVLIIERDLGSTT